MPLPKVPEEQLTTLPEWAAEIRFQVKTVNRWAERHKFTQFPEPVMIMGRIRWYDREVLDRWLRLWKRAHPNILEGHDEA